MASISHRLVARFLAAVVDSASGRNRVAPSHQRLTGLPTLLRSAACTLFLVTALVHAQPSRVAADLAREFSGTPPAEQYALVRRMIAAAGADPLPREIFANELANQNSVSVLSQDAARAALTWLGANAPRFDPQPWRIGASGVANYADWLAAVVRLTEQVHNEAPAAVIGRMVEAEGDPRKLIAVLERQELLALLRANATRERLAAIDREVAAYGAAHTAERNVQQFVASARVRLASVQR